MPTDSGTPNTTAIADYRLLKVFKRQFVRARMARSQLPEAIDLKLQLRFSHNTVSTALSVPEESPTTRFHVAMRRLLNPADRLYMPAVLDAIERRIQIQVGPSSVETARAGLAQLRKSNWCLRVNDGDLAPDSIYELLYTHFYLGSGHNLPPVLRTATSIAPLWGLMWLEFHTYALAAYQVAQVVFECAGKVDAAARLSGGRTRGEHPCIFCRRSDRPFTSEEHIIPESLGNDDLILDRGIVCDACNSGELAKLDLELLDSELVSPMRVLFTDATKEGKPPSARLQNMLIYKTRPGHLHIRPHDRTGEIRNLRKLPSGQTAFEFEVRGRPRFDGRGLARALYKIGLEMVAFDVNPAAALDPRYDDARAFVLEGDVPVNDVLVLTKCKPTPTSIVSWQPGQIGTGLALSIFGVVFLVNLEREPHLTLSDELRGAGFVVLPILPQDSSKG